MGSVEMKMISHQAVGVKLPTCLAAGFGERFQKILAIDIIEENFFTPIASAHQVVNRAGNSIRG